MKTLIYHKSGLVEEKDGLVPSFNMDNWPEVTFMLINDEDMLMSDEYSSDDVLRVEVTL